MRKPSEPASNSLEVTMRRMHATFEHLRPSSVSSERAARRPNRPFKISATRIRSSKKSFKNPRLNMRVFRLLTRSSMLCTWQMSAYLDRISENRVSAELLYCFSKNEQLPNSEETPNYFSLGGTHVSKTNNKESYSSKSAERPI